jgi:2-oxoglutarate dehydrogenase E2 component (dihydrolipoamide succinyltransferase)
MFGSRTEERKKMSPLRKKVATVLKEGQNTAAMLTTFQEVDMSGLMAMRSAHKDEFEAVHGAKLGFLSPFIKAAASSLITPNFAVMNALMDQEAGEVVYRDYVDIGVAVAGPKGLLVPVIRDCHNLSLAGIERQFATLVGKAQDRSISMEELVGGTFSISNGGTFGSMMGTPLINMPQSAILGMHATKMRPTVVNGEIVARPIMYLALTYDHRLIDGREAVLFLCSIRDKIEDPRRLALEL